MFFKYKFSNLLGTIYKKGDLVFSNDGNSIYVPVGNKITCYDLRNSVSSTLPVEVNGDFTALALSPNGLILIAASDDKKVHMISVMRRRLLYSHKMPVQITKITFSPDGKYFAAAAGEAALVICCAGMEKRIFNPFSRQTKHLSSGEVMSLAWSSDSRLLAYGSADCITRIVYVRRKCPLGSNKVNMSSHGMPVVGVYFAQDSYDLHTIGQSGKILRFKCQMTPGELQTLEKTPKSEKEEGNMDKWFLNYTVGFSALSSQLLTNMAGNDDSKTSNEGGTSIFRKVASTCYHPASHVLVIAFVSGEFIIMNVREDVDILHSLNVSNQAVTSVSINRTGDWVALGVAKAGQLLVWEIRSETYVMKQQGHYQSMNVVRYSPDGSCLASGGMDGKVKLWSTVSSFCYVTFTDHTDAVTGIAFTQSGRAVLSASLDGTVRAFDLIRYRNFKTLTSPKATQFSCLSVDSSGELVAAGGQDSHEIYLWSLKLGILLDVLNGHRGPVRSLSFSPVGGSSLLASTGWDQTLLLWDSINSTKARESIDLSADGVCVVLRGDGQQVCVSTVDGSLTMFNTGTGAEEGTIDGRTDMGRFKGDRGKPNKTRYFDSVIYSADGSQLLAGGVSANLCIYSAPDQLLVKTYEITHNSRLTSSMAYREREKVEQRLKKHDVMSSRSLKLPGVMKGDQSLREAEQLIRVTDISFAPTGRSFVVCCTEGLLVYSQDTDWLFDPIALDVSNTPAAVKRKLGSQQWGMALMMAIRLNINNVKEEVLESIPIDAMSVVVSGLAPLYVEGVLQFLSEQLQKSRHVGVYARWAQCVLQTHGGPLKQRAPQLVQTINALHRALDLHYTTLNKLCASNEYTLAYLRRQGQLRKRANARALKREKEEDQQKTNDPQHSSPDTEQPSSDDDMKDSEDESMMSDFSDEDTDTEITQLVVQ